MGINTFSLRTVGWRIEHGFVDPQCRYFEFVSRSSPRVLFARATSYESGPVGGA